MSRKGYRCEELFGDGITDPIEVAFFETRDLGNSDIPEYLIQHDEYLSDEEEQFLKEIDTFDEIDKEYFSEIVANYLRGRNYCKWLCERPEDIWHSYMEPFCNNSTSLESFLKNWDISEYEIPEDAIKLADLGREGSLWCWRKKEI